MKHNYTCEVFNTLQYALTAIQDNPIWQGIQLGLSILTSVVLIAYRLWKWHDEATKDGKITKEEIDSAIDIIADGADKIKDQMKGSDKDGQVHNEP